MNKKALELLLYWIEERYSIFLQKESGSLLEWTKDPILKEYRFCNVFREDDKETKWIHTNWLQPNKNDPNLWFNMAIARFINWHESLKELGYSKRWNPDKFCNILHRRKDEGLKTFTGAYIVSTNGASVSKIDYISYNVLSPLWLNRKKIQPTELDSLQTFYERLIEYDGLGSFMAAQVIADVKHSPVLKKAKDWYTWAARGPGSRRGLNRVYGRDKNSAWSEEAWLSSLKDLSIEVEDKILEITGRKIDNQNLQNCLCEFDKYMRVKNGEGKPRSRYRRIL